MEFLDVVRGELSDELKKNGIVLDEVEQKEGTLTIRAHRNTHISRACCATNSPKHKYDLAYEMCQDVIRWFNSPRLKIGDAVYIGSEENPSYVSAVYAKDGRFFVTANPTDVHGRRGPFYFDMMGRAWRR